MRAQIDPFQLGTPQAAETRNAYQDAARAYRDLHGDLPGGGYVVFWDGQACGWAASVQARPNGWDAGCIAVPALPGEPLYVARGGTYITGAARWEAIVQ